MPQITEDQKEYISRRGFTLLQRDATGKDSYPYLKLSDLEASSTLSYHKTSVNTTEFAANNARAHPSNFQTDPLISMIEDTIASTIEEDGGTYRTSPGQPFRVFVADPAWAVVADALARTYPPQQ